MLVPLTLRLFFPLAVGAAAFQADTSAKPARTSTEQTAFFESQVQPVLRDNCVSCHSGDQPSGGLSLLTREAILKGGVSGPAMAPGKAGGGLLIKAVNHDGRKMPPLGKLPRAQIDALAKWVAMGAPWPKVKPAGAGATGATGITGGILPTVKHGPPQVNAETMRFWSFRPVTAVTPPAVKQTAWARNPIDRFILARLEANGLAPAPQADRAALIRRAYYNLTGLPPSPREVAAFVSDRSPDAWEKVVDRLLASQHYGERWARHWLDLVRYAETNSFERDGAKPFVWRYRDYVIRSLNADKPYDRFVKEQIAGDELPEATPETLIATGYYRLGTWDDEPSDPEQAKYDDLDDIVSTTGQTFLGLTVGCARCHDHKIDPMPQKDYYRLLAFFHNIRRYGGRSGESVAEASLRSIAPDDEKRRYDAQAAEYRAKLVGVETKLKEIERSIDGDLQPVEKEEFRTEAARAAIVKKRVPRMVTQERFDEYVRLTGQRDSLRKSPPPSLAQALCVTEEGLTAGPTYLLMRGNPHAPGDEVEPAFPSVLAPPVPAIRPPTNGETSGRRMALAEWLAGPSNPLTARVIVNRMWQHQFGRGIVRTPSNLGFLGTPPTHPELLDWLAGELVRGGWRMKPIHKLIMMSSAYQMSSRADPKALARDPENDLFQHFDMRRLDAEEIRDSILAVNGTLNPKMYGPSIYPAIPAEVLAGQSMPGAGWDKSTPEEQARRSIYIHIKRSLTVPMLASFDVPETDFTCPARNVTTQPTQALSMLNSAFVNEQAGVYADYVGKGAGADRVEQVRFTLRRVFQREPRPAEVARGVALMQDLVARHAKSESEALRYFCLVALNLNEFLYLD